MTTRDTRTPPEVQRDRLLDRLREQLPTRLHYSAWYRGHGPTPVVQKKYERAYALLQSMSTNSWSRLVVDSLAQRIKMVGVDVGDDQANATVWDLVRANRFDSDQRLVTVDSLATGISYVSVWPDPDGFPHVVPESSHQTIHEVDPVNRRETVAALKVWFDDITHLWYTTLYTAQALYKWVAPATQDVNRPTGNEEVSFYRTSVDLPATDDLDWQARDVEGESWPAPNSLNAVPIVPVPNRPDLFDPTTGNSEIADLEPILLRSDKLTLDMMLAAELAAFRQRWATGLEVPRNQDGKPIEPFSAALDRLWVSDSANAKFGDFGSTDLGPYLKAVESTIANISAVSRVPSYYLVSPSLVNPPSADAMRTAEAGLVSKVKDQQSTFGEAYERMIRLMMRAAQAEPESVSIVWADPETKSDAQLADAALKWQEVGIPQEEIWARLGATPTQIVEWRQENAAATALQLLLAPGVATEPTPNGATTPEPEPVG